MVETLRGLFCSESPLCSTGYGSVMFYLLPELKKRGYEIHMMGWQHNGRPLALPSLGIEYLYSHGLLPFDHPNFPERMSGLMRGLKPDFALSLMDIFHTKGMIKQTAELGVPYINYFPVDAEPFWMGWIEHVQKSTVPLTLSKFGTQIVEDCVHKHVQEAWGKRFKMDYIYHGVNTEIFQPYTPEQKEALRMQVVAKGKPFKDPYFILFVGRNIQRKQVPRLLRAFKIAHKKIPGARLLLKIGNPRDSQGYYLPEYLLRFGLQGLVAFADESTNPLEGIDEHKLADWYNAAHVHVSATSGEGFGLTTLESMACGTPNIITDYSTSEELIGRGKKANGWLVDVECYADGMYNCKRGLVDEKALAKAIIESYENPSLRERYAQRGIEFAKKLTWKHIAKEIDELIRETV